MVLAVFQTRTGRVLGCVWWWGRGAGEGLLQWGSRDSKSFLSTSCSLYLSSPHPKARKGKIVNLFLKQPERGAGPSQGAGHLGYCHLHTLVSWEEIWAGMEAAIGLSKCTSLAVSRERSLYDSPNITVSAFSPDRHRLSFVHFPTNKQRLGHHNSQLFEANHLFLPLLLLEQ
jgi:hypothetical protein